MRDGRPRATRIAAARGVQQLVHHPEEHLSQYTTVQDNMRNNIPSRCIIIDYIPAHYCGSPYPSQSQQHRVKSYTALQCWCTKIFHCQANLNHDRTSQHWLLNLNNIHPSTRLCRTTSTLVNLQSSQGPVQHQLQHHRMLASIELHCCAGELNHSKVECHALNKTKETIQHRAIESCKLRARRAAYINCSPCTRR